MLVAAITGATGAVCRYLLSGAVQSGSKSSFPIGTLTVNLTGALLIGLVAGVGDGSTGTLAAIGFLGGFTTYSTWMIETIRLGMVQLTPRAAINLTVTLTLGVGLTVVGYSLVS